ncbi:MAG TPA: pyridoxal phosphate-dependent aminotransferase [Fastidiosipila sp.]|nr:pyridoxal phosphate-dependent aminotransferase [Fastidiosipila sp.]
MLNERMYKLGSQRSGIRELFEFGQQRAKIVGPENVFDFSIGNPSVPCPDEVTETLKNLLNEDPVKIHAYTSAQGLPSTREAIAESLGKRFEMDVRPQDIILTCGAAAAICTTIRALTASPDDEFMVQAPFFAEYNVFVPEQGGKLVVIEPDLETFDINIDAIEKAITQNTKGLILNSPNNPSGHVASLDTLKTLAAMLKRKSEEIGHPIYIISDEPYRELIYTDTVVPYLPQIYPDSIVCYSFSKALSLPGERIGYIHVPKDAYLSEKIVPAILGALRAMGYVCAPSLFQRAIEQNVDVRPSLDVYRENRNILSDGLKALGYRVIEPEGAFYLFVEAPGGDANAFSEKAKEKDVLVVPGDAFGCPGFMRISYCVKKDTIERALPRFAELI